MSNMKLASGHTVEEMDPKEKEQYHKDFEGNANDMVILNPGRWVLNRPYIALNEKIYNFKFKPDDVVVMTYSKNGTTWMQEIVWTMLFNPNLDNSEAKDTLFSRSPFLEADMIFAGMNANLTPQQIAADPMMGQMLAKFMSLCPGQNPADGLQVQLAAALPGRRVIKTHLPFSLLNPDLLNTAKVIFVARNPKDTVLSFQHHYRLLSAVHGFTGDQDTFVDYFVRNKLLYGPYSEMLKEGWSKRDHTNMHFVFFEDLKADPENELKKIDDFIGARLTSQQLKNVVQHTSFSSMKARDPVNMKNNPVTNNEVAEKDGGFIRKGEAGAWRGKMTEEQSNKIDGYVQKHFQGTGLKFKF